MFETNEDEIGKVIENFVRKSVLVILNSRMSCNDHSNKNSAVYNKQGIDLDDLFLDEYFKLKSTLRTQNDYVLEIYFKRKEVKILIEKWKFKFKNAQTDKKIIILYLKKKLTIMMRSIYTLSRLLPGFSLKTKSGFNFCLDYKFYTNSTKGEEFMSTTNKACLNNLLSTADFNVEIDYLEKTEIFKLENDFKKIEKDNVVYRRPRFLSEDNSNVKVMIPSFEIFNLEDTSIDDNYFLKIDENKTTTEDGEKSSKWKTPHYHNTAPALDTGRIKRISSDETLNKIVTENKKKLISDSYWDTNLTSNKKDNKLIRQSFLDSISSHSSDCDNLPSQIKFKEYDSTMSTYVYNLKQMEKIENAYKTSKTFKNFKNFKTSDTSSLKSEEEEESFELDVEFEEINNSEEENIICLSDCPSGNFKLEEMIKKFKSIKKVLKSQKSSIDYTNFATVFNTFVKNEYDN